MRYFEKQAIWPFKKKTPLIPPGGQPIMDSENFTKLAPNGKSSGFDVVQDPGKKPKISDPDTVNKMKRGTKVYKKMAPDVAKANKLRNRVRGGLIGSGVGFGALAGSQITDNPYVGGLVGAGVGGGGAVFASGGHNASKVTTGLLKGLRFLKGR